MEAFAPGHITGVFVPVVDPPDPLARGSLGAGLVLDRGVKARLQATPAPRSSINLYTHGQAARFPVTAAALGRVLQTSGTTWQVRIDLTHELPISSGLGMSAAGTLAASLALTHFLELEPRVAIEASHVAELLAHSGLGGVAAIVGGGLEVRRKAGIEPFGSIERTQVDADVLVAYREEALPSPPLLSDPEFLARVKTAGTTLLDQLPSPPVTLPSFMEASRRFTENLGLSGDALSRVLLGAESQGYAMAQAMLGHTIFLAREARPGPDSIEEQKKFMAYFGGKGFRVACLHAGREGARILPPAPEEFDLGEE